MFTRIVYGTLSAIAIVYITTQIFSFLGIGFDVYGIYIMYIVALALMYGFLPQNVGRMFN
tara:strand:+ start:1159 stop:1338 length:180 start_codon:yes stop_codon:yes gene_type:complete